MATPKTNPVENVETVDVENPVEKPVNEQPTARPEGGIPKYEGEDRSQKAIVAYLLSNGATKVKDVKAKNVTVSAMENYVRLAFTLDKKVPGMVADPNNEGAYVEGMTNVVFVSLYSVTAQFKENEDTAFAANYLVHHPDSAAIILSHAKFDLIQEQVKEGDTYFNQWSESDNGTVINHDTIFNNIVNIRLSNFGVKALDKMMDKIMSL